VQLPEELLEHSDAIDLMRTINRVRWVVGDIVARQVEEQEGIPFEWFEVLIALAESSDEGLRMSDLATMSLRSKSAMTRLADRIEQQGLIRRGASDADRRVTFVALTDGGRALLERVKRPAAQIMIRHFTSHITSEDARFVTEVLNRILAANGVGPTPSIPESLHGTAAAKEMLH
jgi:DNA-binding MarR family transcriptional regulator